MSPNLIGVLAVFGWLACALLTVYLGGSAMRRGAEQADMPFTMALFVVFLAAPVCLLFALANEVHELAVRRGR